MENEVEDVSSVDEADETFGMIGDVAVKAGSVASQVAQEGMYDQTDAERMKEAYMKYAHDPRVDSVSSMKVERVDGSVYIAPYILAKPDMTPMDLIFPGSRAGGSIRSED